MPFITEEIFCTLQSEEETIMLSQWPEYTESRNYPAEEDMIEDIRKNIPLMNDCDLSMPTNSQLYRIYIERYLRQNPLVAQSLDIIVAQREPTQFGVPVEVYFFLSDKTWAPFERKQSDIFDHLLAMASSFGLRLYQLPMQTE